MQQTNCHPFRRGRLLFVHNGYIADFHTLRRDLMLAHFAAITGEPDGPPTLPPFGLADGISALACAFAITAALRERDASGRGQVIDMAIIEPILAMLGVIAHAAAA